MAKDNTITGQICNTISDQHIKQTGRLVPSFVSGSDVNFKSTNGKIMGRLMGCVQRYFGIGVYWDRVVVNINFPGGHF